MSLYIQSLWFRFSFSSQAFGKPLAGALAGAFSGKLWGATALVVEVVKASRTSLFYIMSFEGVNQGLG